MAFESHLLVCFLLKSKQLPISCLALTFLIFFVCQTHETSDQKVSIWLLAEVQYVRQNLSQELTPLLGGAVLDACLEHA